MLMQMRSLIRPNDVSIETKNETYGKLVIEPLERGYGTTLGNALRRVLLASVPGSAIVGLRIEGALHEFSTLENVVEDVASIILNVKGVQLMVEEDQKYNLSLDVTGPATIKAKDITIPGLVTMLNPDHHIATVNEGGRLVIQFDTDNGVGYVPAEENKSEEDPADRIAVDALYSPVRRVNYRVDPARVGGRTDYDKLVIEVWTNGSLTPEEAVGYCAAILREQFKCFMGDQEFKEEVVEEEPEEQLPTLSEDLYRTVEELELSVRSSNCLKNANIRWIGELVQKTEEDLLQTKNFGRKSLKEIKEILAQLGFSLNMDIEGFDPENPPVIK